MLGAEHPDALIGLPILTIVHPDYHELVRQRVAEEARGAAVPLVQEKFVRLDGREIVVEVAGIPFTHQGKPGGQIEVRDVTERARAEERLREAETRFRTLVEQIPAITYVWHSSPEVEAPTYVSPQVERMLGITPEDTAADPWLWGDRIHPDDREWVLGESDSTEDSGEPFAAEYRMITKDGRTIWVHDEALVTGWNSAGKPVTWQGVLFDITDRRAAEEAVRAAEKRYRTLIEQIPAVTYLWEVTREPGAPNVDYTSPQIEAMLGFTPEEWHERPDFWVSRVHPEDRQRVVDATMEAERTGEESELEYRFIAKDGRVVWVRDYAVLMERDDLGWPKFFQGVMFDVTERKLAEEERARLLSRLVAAQEQERGRIAGDIHDDSVQKMAAVGMRLEALKRQLTEEGQLETLGDLQRSVALSISRLRHLLFELRPTALDTEGLTVALRQYLDQAAAEGGFKYTLENRTRAEPEPEVRTIAYRIAQEALTNVRKHAQANCVDVTLDRHDGGVMVRITDDGVGFDVAEADRGRPGHLGFSAMRERAELAGGWWMVASAPGAGTTVEFWLPTGAEER